MDQDRQIRLLIPPFLFFAWLALGLSFDPPCWAAVIGTRTKDEWVALGAVVAASLLPVGFLFAAFSTLALRILFFVTRRPYEAFLTERSQGILAGVVHLSTPMTRDEQLFAAVTFDHAILAPGVHAWITRSWSAFNVSVNSVAALFAAHCAALLWDIPQSRSWVGLSAGVLLLLLANAIVTWRNTMKMMEFQIAYHERTATLEH